MMMMMMMMMTDDDDDEEEEEEEEQHPTDQLPRLCEVSPVRAITDNWVPLGGKMGRDAPEVLWVGVFVFSKEWPLRNESTLEEHESFWIFNEGRASMFLVIDYFWYTIIGNSPEHRKSARMECARYAHFSDSELQDGLMDPWWWPGWNGLEDHLDFPKK